MISEGLCDTEDWSDDVSLYHRNKLHFKICYNNNKQLLSILRISHITVFTVSFLFLLYFLGEHKKKKSKT